MADQFVLPADARVFLGRLTRLDPGALVRLRPAPHGSGTDGPRTVLWANLPWRVLVTREVEGPAPGDVTVAAAALLAATDALPPRLDPQWRWPLPPGPGEVVEELPAAALRRVGAAAAGVLREAATGGLQGRAVGVRALRDALLDHVAIVVEGDGAPVRVRQRLVQAVLRMGFLGPAATDEPPVRVRRCGQWVGLVARYGTAWSPPPDPLVLRPV